MTLLQNKLLNLYKTKKTINTDIIHIKVQLMQKTDKLGTGNVRNSVIV